MSRTGMSSKTRVFLARGLNLKLSAVCDYESFSLIAEHFNRLVTAILSDDVVTFYASNEGEQLFVDLLVKHLTGAAIWSFIELYKRPHLPLTPAERSRVLVDRKDQPPVNFSEFA